ncbi:response regulator [Fimbriimonas ginsengisoli Gsoil 348]|uniref:Response regulator n=1 Tax=Fimbriimonas ginsengisoli Gsoil 348 TaxID=661478 RepID=A0A068NZ63_FIMGI|nr:response regulator [Fimbriimonas ginsengisoli Gsoil 348]
MDDEVDLVAGLADGLMLSGIETDIAHSGEEALACLRPGAYDAVLTDLNMPGMSGDELLSRALRVDSTLAVIMITAGSDVTRAVECLKAGAFDYILKPFDLEDVTIRLEKALERRRLGLLTRALEAENEVYRRRLEARVHEQAEQLRTIFGRTLRSFTQALEAKDPHTQNHSSRVAGIALLLAQELRPGHPEFLRSLVTAALLHDIGKIGVPEQILLAPGRLTPQEFEAVKKHPVIGETILKPIYSDETILRVVRHHHEAMDGSGYPDKLVGEQIPFAARIVAVADAYDAMTSARSYRPAMPRPDALEILVRGAGVQWDAEVVLTLQDLAQEGRLDHLPETDSFFWEG